MYRYYTLIITLLVALDLRGQGPEVPSRLSFAGIDLKITHGAQREIQRDVDALTRSPKYFNIKVERANQYFPIIERIFREEGLPEDFKYLSLQESALIPDAVSSSNAVGFWQFKKASGEEIGLRMDRHVDERMNIVASTRAAAQYLQKNNYYFNNWVIALQAYQMGAGAAMNAVGEKYNGARKMTIDKDTYWYVKKFLAHMIAFRDAIDHNGKVFLQEYEDGASQSLKDIARKFDTDMDQLVAYNKWLKRGKIPDDKTYTVIIPGENASMIASLSQEQKSQDDYDITRVVNYPEMENVELPDHRFMLEVNGIPGIVARSNDEISTLAEEGDVDIRDFMKYNDINADHNPEDGQVYYLKKKRNRARIYYHTLQYNESLWEVSQKYGIKLKKLRKKNRLDKGTRFRPGLVLWLHKKRPKSTPPEYRELNRRQPVISVAKKEHSGSFLREPDHNQDESNNTENRTDAGRDSDHNRENKGAIQGEKSPKESPSSTTSPPPGDPPNVSVEEGIQRSNPESETNFKKHTVQSGETLFSIARSHDVSINQLVQWNNLNVDDPIQAGQVLKVKVPNTEISELERKFKEKTHKFSLYVVKKGDTMYSIARNFDVTVEELRRWNKKQTNDISIGEKLKIY